MFKFDLDFAQMRLHFQARQQLRLPPYKGSTFRGAFGIAFKRAVCIVQHGDCARCLVRAQCVYPYIFDTPVDNAQGIFRGYQNAPHPYVIEPPLETKTDYAPGDGFAIGLTLIGKALDYVPYFIYAFQRLGETGVGRGARCQWIVAVGLRWAKRDVATRCAAPACHRCDASSDGVTGASFLLHPHTTQSGPRVATGIEFFRVDPRAVAAVFCAVRISRRWAAGFELRRLDCTCKRRANCGSQFDLAHMGTVFKPQEPPHAGKRFYGRCGV